MNRLDALRDAMETADIDLVVIGPTANLRYLLGYRAMAIERITVLLVSRNSAAMVLPEFDRGEFVESTGFERAFGWTDAAGPERAIAAAFGEAGLVRRALVDDELRFDFFTLLRDRLGSTPGRAAELLAPLRLVKSADEQEAVARAGELVSLGIDVALERAQPGVTELELKRAVEEALWERGAESVDFVLVQAGANAAAPHHNADATPLREGESVLVDVAARFDGYFADITQQAFIGEPPEEFSRAYDAVAAAHAAGVDAARAGATAGDVDRAASDVRADAGFGQWRGTRTGHGLGLDVHEPPSVMDGDETELVPGTVITVEPGVYVPGRYGVRIEDTVIVTDGAPRVVTRAARPLVTKPS